MTVIAFVLLLIATVIFAIEYSRGKALISLGLAFLTVGLIAQFAIESKTITF